MLTSLAMCGMCYLCKEMFIPRLCAIFVKKCVFKEMCSLQAYVPSVQKNVSSLHAYFFCDVRHVSSLRMCHLCMPTCVCRSDRVRREDKEWHDGKPAGEDAGKSKGDL